MRHLAAASLVAVLGLAGCASATSGNNAAAEPPSSTAASSTATPVSASTSPAPFATAVYALEGDAVVRVDPDTGSVTRRYVLASAGGLHNLTYVPRKHVILVTRTTTEGDDEIVEVSLDDGATRVLVSGRNPAVSPSGDEIAYVRTVERGGRTLLQLVRATYDGNVEQTWTSVEDPGRPVDIDSISFRPESDDLLFTLRWDEGTQLRLLPGDATGTIRGASEIIEPTSSGAVFSTAVFRDPQTMTVAEGCCEADGYRHWEVIDLTVVARERKDLVTGLDRPVAHVDWTLDQRQLAVTLAQVPLDTAGGTAGAGTPPRPLLWTRTHQAQLDTGLTSAEW